MKKVLFFLTIACFSFSPPESSLYQLKFKSLDKEDIDMAYYKGKKIVIVVFNASEPDYKQLLGLDTLYQRHKNHVAVIAIPTEDFGKAMQKSSLLGHLRDSAKLHYPITEIGKAQKKHENAQHSILQWLTNKSSNQHFDVDIEEAGQMYVISESGVLYAVLKHRIAPMSKMMFEVLERQVKD